MDRKTVGKGVVAAVLAAVAGVSTANVAAAAGTTCTGRAEVPYFAQGLAILMAENTASCTGPQSATQEVRLQWLPPNSKTWVTIKGKLEGVPANSTRSIVVSHFCEGTIATRYRTAGTIYLPGGAGFSNPSSSIVVPCSYFP